MGQKYYPAWSMQHYVTYPGAVWIKENSTTIPGGNHSEHRVEVGVLVVCGQVEAVCEVFAGVHLDLEALLLPGLDQGVEVGRRRRWVATQHGAV